MLACRVVCCAHQSDRRIWVCISHQLYRNIWISYTNHRRKRKCWTNQTLNQDFFPDLLHDPCKPRRQF